MVVDTWPEYMKSIDGTDLSPEMVRELECEGEFCARRVAALKAGVLRCYRIVGVRPVDHSGPLTSGDDALMVRRPSQSGQENQR